MNCILRCNFAVKVLFIGVSSTPFVVRRRCKLSPLSFDLYFKVGTVTVIVSSTVSVGLPAVRQTLCVKDQNVLSMSTLLVMFLSLGSSF